MWLTPLLAKGAGAQTSSKLSQSRTCTPVSPEARDTSTNAEQNKTATWEIRMIRLARDSMALASLGGFVWMVCAAVQLVS